MLQGIIALFINQIFGNTVVPIGTKIAAPLTGTFIFIFFRFFVGCVILYFIYICSKRKKITSSGYADFAKLGLILFVNISLFTIGIAYTNVIMSSLIFSATPVIVGIGGHFYLKETFDKQKLLGVLISFIGILFLLSRSLSETQQNIFGQPLGNILICFSTIGYSCYILYSRKILHKNDNAAIQTTFLTYVFSTICSFLTLCLGIAFKSIVLKLIPASGTFGFLLVGVGSLIQYLFLQIGIKKTSAFTASLFQYIGPFIATLAAIPILHELVTLQLVLGGFLILLGVFIATTYDLLLVRVKK